MYRPLSGLFAVGLAANGTFMIASPAAWYSIVPGVSETGPFNSHFVRDIGCAFMVAAIGFAWTVFDRERARPAVLAGVTFLCLHALVHLWDLIAGREDPHHLVLDLPAILLPAVVGLWLARPASEERGAVLRRAPRAGRGIIERLAEPTLSSYERDYDYDTTYLRHVARASGWAFLRFSLFSAFAQHREATPVEAWFVTKLAAALREDCGPCTQLVVRMAEQHAVTPDDIRGVLTGDERAMSVNASLAMRFANAVLDRDVTTSNRLRREVVERWGEQALVTLAFAIASARVYPTIKYALGHGQACSRVSVGNEQVLVARPALFSPNAVSAHE